jgi:DNA invertase Pin-like site-specific DNA recombinase
MAAFTLRAVGYRRVSMREQLDGFSLEAQAESIRKFASERNWKLVHIYTDAGISAKKDSERPQFMKLMNDSKDGRFDVVIVDKIDRFYRHLNGLLNALDQLNNQKVTFVSVQERIDFTTPWGKLTLTMLGMLAEIYVDNLRQETQKGKLQRARDGWWNGNIPLGYCRGLCSKCDDPNGPGYCPDVGQPDKSDGRLLVIHPIDGQAVRTAFDLYLNEVQSNVLIAEKLNQTTFCLPDGTRMMYRQKGITGRKEPSPYTKDFVRGMLSQVFYTGKVAYYGRGRKRKIEALFPGKHPVLIPEADFQRAMEIRKSIGLVGRSKNNSSPRVYPLTGILHCGKCGWPMRGTSVGKAVIHTYKDSGQVERSGLCDQKYIRSIPLEMQVIDLMYKAIRVWEKSISPGLVSKLIEDAEGQVQRVNQLYILGEVSHDDVRLEKERFERIVKPWRENNFADTRLFVENLQSIHGTWDQMKDYDQKRLFHLAFERIFVRNIVAIQPTPLFFPVMTVFLKGDNRTVTGNRRAKPANCRLELLTPGLRSEEALMVLDHRINRDFK